MAYALKAWLHLLGTEPAGLAVGMTPSMRRRACR